MEQDRLSPKQFERFRDFIYRTCGIHLDPTKTTLVTNRIRRRLRAPEFADFDQHYEHLTSHPGNGGLELFLDAITTNETHFFRTAIRFDWFRREFLTEGSSAMMGLDSITILTHHLENHFERLRSGLVTLDQGMMDVILRGIDFLRECNARLRARRPLGSAPQLLEELNALNSGAPDPRPQEEPRSHQEFPAPPVEQVLSEPVSASAELRSTSPPSLPLRSYWVHIQFEPDLQLADLKAELVLGRLADFAVVHQTHASRDQWDRIQLLSSLEILLSSDRAPADLRAAANLDGIDWIEIEEGPEGRERADDGPGLSTGAKGVEAPEVSETSEDASSPQVAAAEVATQQQVGSEPIRKELVPVGSAWQRTSLGERRVGPRC